MFFTLDEDTLFVLDLPSDSENSDFDDLPGEEDFGSRNKSTGPDIHVDDSITVTLLSFFVQNKSDNNNNNNNNKKGLSQPWQWPTRACLN